MNARPSLPGDHTVPLEHLLDRMLADVRTGRFEQTLAALTAAGAAITAAEIYTEHDSASFGNKMMWWPVRHPADGDPGRDRRRLLQAGGQDRAAARPRWRSWSTGCRAPTCTGAGIAQKPGGWSLALYNMEMGPPVFAPLLASLVGGMGLLAAVLRREDRA